MPSKTASNVEVIAIDAYVLDTLMHDLIGHDRAPSAFVVYLHLWRESLGAGAGASLVKPVFPYSALSRLRSPNDRVRFGMIGIGMQGNSLLGTSIQLEGVECAAAADLYDGRHTLAREIVRPDLPVTRRYRELLDNKDIDCIVAAVPDHWHRQVVVDAVSAGKDIYCEKPMSHTPADGVAMVDAAKKSGRIVQIGSQRVSSQVCAKAK